MSQVGQDLRNSWEFPETRARVVTIVGAVRIHMFKHSFAYDSSHFCAVAADSAGPARYPGSVGI
jgi:hypothetical protein